MPRLSKMHIESSILDILKNLDSPILTAEQLLSVPFHELRRTMQAEALKYGTKLSLDDILHLVEHVARSCMAKETSALELFTARQQPRHLSTSILSLDKLLDGGLPLGNIIEIFGHSQSGKTQTCTTVATTAAVNGHTIAYFTHAVPSISSRIAQIAQLRLILPPTLDSDNALKELFTRIHFYSVTDIYQVLDTLETISYHLQQSHASYKGMKLIIIHPINEILAVTQERGMMAHLMQYLKHLAIEYDLCVLITNGAVRTPGSDLYRPALGSCWSFFPNIQIQTSEAPQLEYQEDKNEDKRYSYTLVKIPYKRTGETALFQIKGAGVI